MIEDTWVMKKAILSSFGITQVKCDSAEQSGMKCRPSELPFYTENRQPQPSEEREEEPSLIVQKTAEIRQGLFNSLSFASNTINEVTDKINLNQAKEWTSYLREEENIVPRTGAIALGGLSGLIFGLRGGLFRRTLYTTVGTLTMAAVCYPKEAAVYSQIALDDSKRYLTIAYNFVYGVKPGDPQKELPSLPTIPTSLSEVWSLTTDLGRSTKNLILGSFSKDTDSDSKVGGTEKLENVSLIEKLVNAVRTLYQEKETIETDSEPNSSTPFPTTIPEHDRERQEVKLTDEERSRKWDLGEDNIIKFTVSAS